MTNGFDKVGPYQLIKKIGQGGMGVVYEAVRDDHQYSKTVAIKILSSPLLSEEAGKRFYRERQILANLSHPNVAQLYDGGVTDYGVPYIVMEFINGVNILDYCQQQKLSIIQRLNLFREVCQAVEHAHKNLIIHRDLKPDNILIDQQGRVKLLDFGIAKVLDDESLFSSANLTQITGSPMTPQYASPEVFTGGHISTVSDVYSLGVLLYELLTGKPPYVMTDAVVSEFSFDDGQNIIPPSYQVQKHQASKDRCFNKEWKKTLRGDLDWIVLKALRFIPDDRYSSALQFETDVVRYLNTEPVLARPPNRLYTLRKFFKRHIAWVSGGVAVFLLMISLLVLASMYLHDLRVGNQLLAVERDRANQSAEFLIELFENRTMSKGQGHKVSVKDLLNEGYTNLKEKNNLDPKLKISLSMILGRLYIESGDYDVGLDILNSVSSIQRETDGLALSTTELGDLNFYLGKGYLYQSQTDQALNSFSRAIKYFESDKEHHLESLILAYQSMGNVLTKKGQFEKSNSFIQRSIDLCDLLIEGSNIYLGYSFSAMATNSQMLGRYNESVDYYMNAIRSLKDHHGELHPRLAVNYHNLANTLVLMGNYSKGIIYYNKTLVVDKALLGEHHPEVGITLMNLGIAWRQQGEVVKANEYFSESMYILNKALGDEHEESVLARYNFAKNYQLFGDQNNAVTLLNQTLDEFESLGSPSYRMIATKNALANGYLQLNQFEKAKDLNDQSIDGTEKLFGENHSDLIELKCTKALIHASEGDSMLALKSFQEVKQILQVKHKSSFQIEHCLKKYYQLLLSIYIRE